MTRLSILRLVVRAMVEVSTYFRWRVAWVIPQRHHVCRRVVGIYLSLGDCPADPRRCPAAKLTGREMMVLTKMWTEPYQQGLSLY